VQGVCIEPGAARVGEVGEVGTEMTIWRRIRELIAEYRYRRAEREGIKLY
jgi:hypothetical protein